MTVFVSFLLLLLFMTLQDILADDGAAGEEERRRRLFKGLKFFFGREVCVMKDDEHANVAGCCGCLLNCFLHCLQNCFTCFCVAVLRVRQLSMPWPS